MTGLNTTHHTNATVFNPKNEETSIITQEIIDDVHEESRPLTKKKHKQLQGLSTSYRKLH